LILPSTLIPETWPLGDDDNDVYDDDDDVYDDVYDDDDDDVYNDDVYDDDDVYVDDGYDDDDNVTHSSYSRYQEVSIIETRLEVGVNEEAVLAILLRW